MFKLISEIVDVGAFDPEAISAMTNALDRAWGSLQASGAPWSSDDEAQIAREILAKYIIKAARNGQRDQQQLSQGALLHLAKTSLRPSVRGAQRQEPNRA